MTPVSASAILIPALREPFDPGLLEEDGRWEQFREAAPKLGVAALVACAARPYLQGADREWCDRVLRAAWARYDQSLSQLDSVLGTLAAGGVQALALKGPLLAQRCYTPPFLRKPSIDLDLAVRAADIERACSLMRAEGYELEMPLREAFAIHHHAILLHPSRLRIEMHFRLSHGAMGIPVDEFFPRARAVPLPSGRSALVPAGADELLHLMLHVVKDRFASFFHLYELRRVWFAASGEDRVAAIARAEQHHFAGSLRLADVAIRENWGETLIPAGVRVSRTWLNWRIGARLYRQMESASGPGSELTLARRLHLRWLEFQATDRFTDGLRFAAVFVRSTVFGLLNRRWHTVRYKHHAGAGSGGAPAA